MRGEVFFCATLVVSDREWSKLNDDRHAAQEWHPLNEGGMSNRNASKPLTPPHVSSGLSFHSFPVYGHEPYSADHKWKPHYYNTRFIPSLFFVYVVCWSFDVVRRQTFPRKPYPWDHVISWVNISAPSVRSLGPLTKTLDRAISARSFVWRNRNSCFCHIVDFPTCWLKGASIYDVHIGGRKVVMEERMW